MEEALSESEEKMDTGTTPAAATTVGSYSPGIKRDLLQDLNEDEWANTGTPPLGSPRKVLEFQLRSQPAVMGMVFLSDESKGKITFEGNRTAFLSTGGMAKVLARIQPKTAGYCS